METTSDGSGFSKDFVWGAASAAYQIEGAAREDGRGLSVWDVFGRKPGAIWQGQTGDEACDHYHRVDEDLGIMRELGLPAYRFSVAWPRVLPEGRGAVNEKGLAFYDRLVDGLLAAGIEPWVTLFHWDYPYELHCRGGWLNPDSPRWFADYADLLARRLGDRVRNWMTFNEPNGMTWAGYKKGIHAPGLTFGPMELLRQIHHIQLAHGRAVQALRSGCREARIGFVLAGGGVRVPASDAPADIEAARSAMFDIRDPGQVAEVVTGESWWLDPVYLGRHPEDGRRVYADLLPPMGEDDLSVIGQPLDFFGLNIYRGHRVKAGEDGRPEEVPFPVGAPYVAAGDAHVWPLMPESLYWGPRFYHERYGRPVFITENGMADQDWIHADGQVHDPRRIDYIRRYLCALRRAARDGVDVGGYFAWSILDNLEWSAGYRERFGLVFVDYPTQRRIIKDSGRWYADVIASNGATLSSLVSPT